MAYAFHIDTGCGTDFRLRLFAFHTYIKKCMISMIRDCTSSAIVHIHLSPQSQITPPLNSGLPYSPDDIGCQGPANPSSGFPRSLPFPTLQQPDCSPKGRTPLCAVRQGQLSEFHQYLSRLKPCQPPQAFVVVGWQCLRLPCLLGAGRGQGPSRRRQGLAPTIMREKAMTTMAMTPLLPW